MIQPRAVHTGSIREALPLVIAGFAISFVVVGGGIDTVSVFLNAITKATGWSRSALSAGVSSGALMAALSTPIVGIGSYEAACGPHPNPLPCRKVARERGACFPWFSQERSA